MKGNIMTQSLIDGTTIKLGGKTYVIPPLNFARLKKLREELSILSAANTSGIGMSPELLDASITVILSALNRNYPDMTRDEVEELIDLRNMQEIMAAITGQSGLERRAGEI